MNNKGTFILSLDTELAWGAFDKENINKYEEAYRNTPLVINKLCKLLDNYNISATWAIVTHLLEQCDGDHSGRPSLDSDWINNWFGKMPCMNGIDKDLWYAPWLLDRLQSCDTEQEIGIHGSTHMLLGADGCSRQHAEAEIDSAVSTLGEHGIDPKSFVFPRNNIGYLDILQEYGIKVYRGVDAQWYERAYVPGPVKPPLRFINEAIYRSPPLVNPIKRDGLIEVPGSQVFRPSYGGWQYTLGDSNLTRIKKGLKCAAETAGVFHLWFHPFNLGHNPEKDLHRMKQVLDIVNNLETEGKIQCKMLKNMREIGE